MSKMDIFRPNVKVAATCEEKPWVLFQFLSNSSSLVASFVCSSVCPFVPHQKALGIFSISIRLQVQSKVQTPFYPFFIHSLNFLPTHRIRSSVPPSLSLSWLIKLWCSSLIDCDEWKSFNFCSRLSLRTRSGFVQQRSHHIKSNSSSWWCWWFRCWSCWGWCWWWWWFWFCWG